MNDADWDFLKPWLQILAPVVFLPDANQPLNGNDKDDYASLQPRVPHLGIDPFLELLSSMFSAGGGGGLNLDKMQKIGRAMELVALALRLEPRVWGLIRDRSGEPLLDMTAYDPKQLGAGLLVKCTGVEMVGPAYAALFVVGDDGTGSMGGMGGMGGPMGAMALLGGMGGLGRLGGMHQPLPYNADRERLEKMFRRKGMFMPSYQIPLAIVIGRSRGDVPISEIQKFFDNIAITMHVETALPPRMMQAGWATYRVHDVYAEACDGTRSEMARLKRSGVTITGATNTHYMSHESLLAIVESGSGSELKAINIHPDSNEGAARLYTALSCGGCIGVLTVEVFSTHSIKQLAQVLRLTNGKCKALHRLDINVSGSLDLAACEALGRAIDVASRGPRRLARLLKKVHANGAKGAVLPLLEGDKEDEEKVVVVLPDGNAIEVARDAVEAFDETEAGVEAASLWTTTSPIETFSLRAKVTDSQAALKIVRLLQRCLPSSLKSLSLDVAGIDDTCLTVILESFPQLQKLRVKDASVTTADPLLAAYNDRGCNIQALELGAHGLDVTGLLKSLENPMTRIAKTLKQLQLNCPYDEEPREEFLEALKKMLRANHSLTYVKLAKLGEDKEDISEQLRNFREAPLSTQTKLALISVIFQASQDPDKSAGLGSLDSKTVNTIMRMAKKPRFRVVCVE